MLFVFRITNKLNMTCANITYFLIKLYLAFAIMSEKTILINKTFLFSMIIQQS